MGCTIFKSQRQTRAQAVAILGHSYACPHEWGKDEYGRDIRHDPAACDNEVISEEGQRIFLCGSGPVAPTCRCGHLADLLCDWPIGKGKTCDLPLCSSCSVRIGDDQDLCLIHHNLFAKDNPLPHVFGKGTRIVR
jgi:hypothetical protein